MAPLTRASEDEKGATVELPLPQKLGTGTARYKIPKLNTAGYNYAIYIDLHTKLSFDNEGNRARYGGTYLAPEDIAPEVTLEFTLNNDATIKSCEISGVYAGDLVRNGPFTPGKINVYSEVFDDPFIFPRFFRTNVIGIVVSVPLDRFPKDQKNFVVWATTSKDGKEIDHVGRSQRTQLPRFDYLNTLPPAQHVAAINQHHEDPSLLWDFARSMLSPLFGRRPYDAVPDTIIFRRDQPTLFPNGRKLADDVGGIIAQTGDTQLWEASYTEDSRYPRITTNDGDRGPNDKGPEVALKPYRTNFPYLATAWTVDEVAAAPPFGNPGRPNLSDANWRKLWLLEIAPTLALIALLFWVVRSLRLRIGLLVLAILAALSLSAVYMANITGPVTTQPSPSGRDSGWLTLIAGVLLLIALFVRPRKIRLGLLLGGLVVITLVWLLSRFTGSAMPFSAAPGTTWSWIAIVAGVILLGIWTVFSRSSPVCLGIAGVLFAVVVGLLLFASPVSAMDQPSVKLNRLELGGGLIVVLLFTFIYALGRRCGAKAELRK